MRSLAAIRARTPKTEMFRGQVQHIMIAILLVAGTCALLRDTGGRFLGVGVITWAKISIAATLIHQISVAVVFRLQLHLDSMVRLFGDKALKVWGILFLPQLFLRPTLVLFAGLASVGTLDGNRQLQIIGGVLLLLPVVWGMHSVIRYFTINRALGGDHFYDKYLNMPMVDKGAFRYSDNAMYSIVFLGFWAIALLTGSWNALVLALFQHAYIWVHMYCTEDPDMRILYSDPPKPEQP